MNYCKVFKIAKKNQCSFRITKELLESVYEKARKVKKKSMLVLTIPINEKNQFKIEGIITKEKL